MTTPDTDKQPIHIDPYEKGWMVASIFLLGLFAIAITIAGTAMGIQLPAPEARVNPNTVADAGPFAEPGLRELAPGKYDAYLMAQTWLFTPREITVPVGSEVTFYITTKDVIHGFKLDGTNINLMVVPGQVSKLSHRFTTPGTFNWVCHEYCGLGHAAMFGQVIVTP